MRAPFFCTAISLFLLGVFPIVTYSQEAIDVSDASEPIVADAAISMLAKELQALGLPAEHAAKTGREFFRYADKLTAPRGRKQSRTTKFTFTVHDTHSRMPIECKIKKVGNIRLAVCLDSDALANASPIYYCTILTTDESNLVDSYSGHAVCFVVVGANEKGNAAPVGPLKKKTEASNQDGG